MDLNKLKTDYQNKINTATNSAELEAIRIELLGRNGIINKLFSEIKTTTNPKEYGANLNNLKKQDSSDVFIEKNLEEDNKKKEIRQQIFWFFLKIRRVNPLTHRPHEYMKDSFLRRKPFQKCHRWFPAP